MTFTGADGQGRWLAIALFGETIGEHFERGVSQFPTIDDEVHLVTAEDLRIIYGETAGEDQLEIGHIASSSGIAGGLGLNKLLTRHCAVVGSTGSGKSNMVGVLLEALADPSLPSARVLVIDPHGEYASAVGNSGRVFRVTPESTDDQRLFVPFWALPFDELCDIALGQMQPGAESAVRDEVSARKMAAAANLRQRPPEEAVTADSPIPFCIRKLWFDLDDYERHTLADRTTGRAAALVRAGNPDSLLSNIYPDPATGNTAPFVGPRRGISRQLEVLRSRLADGRFRFLFSPGDRLTPAEDGSISGDLHELAASWVGHDRPITVLDVSGLPSEVRGAIIGTTLRIVYDLLFWSGDLPIAGKQQPLLIVLEEAHLYLPEGTKSAAHRTVTKIAKEGRKYGVGLLVVTQRPSEIDHTVLSQCGTLISLRLTNAGDRSVVAAAMPDDLAGLSSMLPALRTGEALAVGEAVPIPTRIRIRRARQKIEGSDPHVSDAWAVDPRPDSAHYATAVARWRAQSLVTGVTNDEQGDSDD
jgi:DNA helicase HerA-like ATPase